MKPIFNIFSKTIPKIKKEILPKEKIIVDYREKNSLVASELRRLGLNVEFKELKVADYIVKDIAIERKTVSDFIGSMINKRLLNQLEELQQYENKLLIIEGIDEQELYTDSEENSVRFHRRQLETAHPRQEGKSKKTVGCFQGVHPNSVRGFLLSILLKHKIPIIFTKNSEDTAKFILILSKRKEKELSLNVNKKTLNKKDRMQFILESFPSIGPKTAKKLLKKFKTIKNIVNASQEELKKVIGKKAEILKKIIDGEY